jgi:hypothetical protein
MGRKGRSAVTMACTVLIRERQWMSVMGKLVDDLLLYRRIR